MRTLAAIMASITLVTTALFAHALASASEPTRVVSLVPAR
jgi:hypothetical protein